MNTVELSKECRCHHKRRRHNTGTIFEGYRTQCYDCGCLYFEAVVGWQHVFADALRREGYIVERVVRDERGRFLPARQQVPA